MKNKKLVPLPLRIQEKIVLSLPQKNKNTPPPLPSRREFGGTDLKKISLPLPSRIDAFEKIMKKDLLKLNSVQKSLVGNKKVYNISLSYDMLEIFMEKFSVVDFSNNSSVIFNITLFDERKDVSKEELLKIEKFMMFLQNNFIGVIGTFILNLSDSMMGKYNQIINNIFLLEKIRPKFRYNLSIDRHPVNYYDRDELCMSKCLGNVDFLVQQLMMLSNEDLEYLYKNNYISSRYYRDATELKKVVYEFDKYLIDNFDIDNMSEFHKVMVVYNYMKENIKYAVEATIVKDGIQMINPQSEESRWVFDPYDTYINSRGVCSGQSRLMSILLNHSLLKMDSYVLVGEHKKTQHAWVGVVINNKLYQCCITMRKPMLPLDMLGYKLDSGNTINLVYPLGYLTTSQVEEINRDLEIGGRYRKRRDFVRTLKKEKYL